MPKYLEQGDLSRVLNTVWVHGTKDLSPIFLKNVFSCILIYFLLTTETDSQKSLKSLQKYNSFNDNIYNFEQFYNSLNEVSQTYTGLFCVGFPGERNIKGNKFCPVYEAEYRFFYNILDFFSLMVTMTMKWQPKIGMNWTKRKF